jgi:hypothetical protein
MSCVGPGPTAAEGSEFSVADQLLPRFDTTVGSGAPRRDRLDYVDNLDLGRTGS